MGRLRVWAGRWTQGFGVFRPLVYYCYQLISPGCYILYNHISNSKIEQPPQSPKMSTSVTRKSQCSLSLLNKTNRQFYIRRKKSPEDISEMKLGKVLKSLIRKNQTFRESKPDNKRILYTEQESRSRQKFSDKYFQLLESKRVLEQNLKKSHPTHTKLLTCFQKCLSSQSIQQIQSQQLHFYQLLNCAILLELDKIRSLQMTSESDQKNKIGKENALFLENMRLEKENGLLRRQLDYGLPANQQIGKEIVCDQLIKSRAAKYIESIKGSKPTNQDFITNFVMMERKLEIKSQELEIMKREVESLKQQLFLLRDQKKSLKQRISQLKIKNQNLCSQIIGLQLKNKKMGVSDDRRQAIMGMQYEQIESYRYEMSELKKLYLNLSKKYKGLIIKFKKTAGDNNNKLGAMFNRQMRMFPEQFQAFEEVRGKVHPSNKIHTFSVRDRKLDKSALYQQYLGPKQTINNKEGIKKAYSIGSQYYHPTFYALISQDINFFGIDQTNFQHFNQTIKLNFIGTARAILDSKFNQFILNRTHGTCCSFPSFVLSWLNTYQLGATKKIEKIVSSNISTRETVCTFYVNLMSEKLNYSWEVIAFREFLLETFGNDQLYFYVNLRHLLVGGDITDDLSFCFEQIYYIDFNRGFSTISKVIKQNDTESRKIYQEFLKRSIIYIRKKSFLDLHYVLRILLEYYQTTKQRQIDTILKTIDMIMQGNRKQNIILLDFQKIFDYHFTFLSYTEIIELYRKCYCISNGCVTPEIVLTVLTQENVFLRWVDTFMVNPHIRIDEIQGQEEENSFVITPNIDWIYQNERRYRYILNSQLRRQSERLGIEQLSNYITKLSKLNSTTIFTRMQLLFSICMTISKKFYYSGITNNDQLHDALQLTSQYLTNLSKVTLRRNQIFSLMRYFKQKAATRRIVKFYQTKKAQMTRSILYTYSATSMREEPEERNEILRTEFMQIIEEAKGKKRESSRANIQEI